VKQVNAGAGMIEDGRRRAAQVLKL